MFFLGPGGVGGGGSVTMLPKHPEWLGHRATPMKIGVTNL